MPDSHRDSDLLTVYAHNPAPLMRKRSTRRPARKATPRRRTTTTARKRTTTPARRRKTTARRRNPVAVRSTRGGFTKRATAAYAQAGGVVVGSIAAEQVTGLLTPALNKSASMPSWAADAASVILPGALGVLLMGSRGAFGQNAGLGMVSTSAANAVGMVTKSIAGATATSGARGYGAQYGGGQPALAGYAPQHQLAAARGGSCGCGTGVRANTPAGVLANSF